MKYLLSVILVSICLCGTAQNSKLVVHEWGTFTSRYTGIGKAHQDLNKVIDEKVPDFVYHIDFDSMNIPSGLIAKGEYYYSNKLLSLQDVSVKMETPVLYFYTKDPINDLDVKVNFPEGSISEFYPYPYKQEDSNYVRSKVKFNTVTIDPDVPVMEQRPYLTFANYNGFASWRINILAKSDQVLPSVPDENVPNVWLAPRKTNSNIIDAHGEREKYIFYRGLASFVNPVIPAYTKTGNILVKNGVGENLNYVLIYEMTNDGRRYIWEKKLDLNSGTESIFKRGERIIGDEEWNQTYRLSFINGLVREGLYQDEAEAMLNTWEKSYFYKPGIKIFWTVPRSFTDKILPISFSIKPSSLERVMVGRTEIDSYDSREVLDYMDEPEQTPIVENSNDSKIEYTIFPNPTSSDLFLRSNNSKPINIEILLIDFSGKEVDKTELEINPDTDVKIPFKDHSNGIYRLKIIGKEKKGCKQFNISIQ